MADRTPEQIAEGLCAYERDVLVDFATGSPRRWGGAIGQALEVLRSRGCVTHMFEVTDLGHAVAEAIKRKAATGG